MALDILTQAPSLEDPGTALRDLRFRLILAPLALCLPPRPALYRHDGRPRVHR